MIAKICQMANKHFSPLMIVLVLVGVLAKMKQAEQRSNEILNYKLN